MISYIKKTIIHPLISGTIIVFLGTIFASFFNFVFNLFISRNLTVEHYGTVASLLAILTLFGIASAAVIPTIVKFTTDSFESNDLRQIKSIYFKIANPFFIIAGLILLIFIIFQNIISDFLNISNESILILLTGITIFISFALVLNNALLQARLSFLLLSLFNTVSAFIKVALGIAFVLSGYKTFGVMVAVFLSVLIHYILTFFPLRFLFNKGTGKAEIDLEKIIKFAAPSGIAMLALTSLISTDLILVKHLFDSTSAGIYAGISLIGRVIFFISAPIIIVMFPMIARRHAKKENYDKLFFASIFLVASTSLSIVFFYFLFPDFVIKLFLKNEAYLIAAPLLGYFGIFIALYSLCSIMMYYFLSIGKTKVYIPILSGAIFQIIAIYIFHNSYKDILTISIITSFSIFITLCIYYMWVTGLYKKIKQKVASN